LGVDELAPGQEGWLQLETVEPSVAARGDRYILRRPSPGETIGGGTVVDPQPKGRHRRFAEATLAGLESLRSGAPEDVLLQAALALGAAPLKDMIARSGLEPTEASAATAALIAAGALVGLEGDPHAPNPGDLVLPLGGWEALAGRVCADLESYHRQYPLRGGMPREELKSRLKDALRAGPRLFTAALRRLAEQGEIEEAGPLLRRAGHTVRFGLEQERRITALLSKFATAPYSPPSYKDVQAEVGEDVAAALIETGRLMAVSGEVVFRRQDYERMVEEIRSLIEARGSLTAAEARDHFNTSRKYILALLEHLDATGITVRDGDVRRLRGRATYSRRTSIQTRIDF
jgi:selenocysteine-specific elongation factor